MTTSSPVGSFCLAMCLELVWLGFAWQEFVWFLANAPLVAARAERRTVVKSMVVLLVVGCLEQLLLRNYEIVVVVVVLLLACECDGRRIPVGGNMSFTYSNSHLPLVLDGSYCMAVSTTNRNVMEE